MLKVLNDGTIQMIRGNTVNLTISIYNAVSNDEYEVGEGDLLRLSVKRTIESGRLAFQKVAQNGNQFLIVPGDTKNLPVGKYVYDVELKTASGDVYTVVVPTTFEILPEVTQ